MYIGRQSLKYIFKTILRFEILSRRFPFIISFFHRLLTMLGFQQFLAQDGDVTLELVEEGKEHIKREKRRRQRLAESATRRRDFANRFGDIEANSRGKIKVHF